MLQGKTRIHSKKGDKRSRMIDVSFEELDMTVFLPKTLPSFILLEGLTTELLILAKKIQKQLLQ